MSNFLTDKFISISLATFSLAIIGIVTLASIDSVGGDAPIYLAYAKNFWENPFSVRPNGPPEFGATGPLWVIWLSLFGNNFVLLKLFNFLVICLSFFWGIRYLNFYLFIPLLILYLGSFIFMNALIYEAPLFLLLLTCIFINITIYIYIFTNKLWFQASLRKPHDLTVLFKRMQHYVYRDDCP